MDRVRVARLLVYEGPREWVEKCLKQSEVPIDGVKVLNKKDGCLIKSALIDKFAEIIEQPIKSDSSENVELSHYLALKDFPQGNFCKGQLVRAVFEEDYAIVDEVASIPLDVFLEYFEFVD